MRICAWISSTPSTAPRWLLSKASATAAQMSQQQNCLLLSPIALALHTLVAEFLYEQNFHYTLSVFCSEMPHRHTLPDFEGRAEFRFNQEELQQVLTAVLGEHRETPVQFGQTLLQTYGKPKQSLLLALLKTLGDSRRTDLTQVNESTMTHRAWESRTEATQTEPAACVQSSPDGDNSHLYQTEELVVAADGRTVFIGPRVSQSLNGVEQQLSQLMHYMDALCKSCAPPVEIIPFKAFEQLLQQEILERERLLVTGQTLGPGQTAIQLPELTQQHETQVARQDGNTVLSPVGPIQLPADSPSVPKLPHLHAEQVASLAMVQQALQKFQQQTHQPQDCMYITLDRLEALVGELAGCVQTLSNVLNLAMEQEYAVGRHKGFKLGYREGFSHGHYMGVQEGMQCQKQQQQQQHRDTSSQTQILSAPCTMQTVATQTRRLRQRHITTNTDHIQQCLKDAASQTTPAPAPAPAPVPVAAAVPAPAPATKASPSRSYEQWIFEMLHSHSGHIFLERVELSLNKALEQQKQRLDELFDVKLRHHAELMRLSRRQSSWRTLCRHVERDSHSSEARELVHKIFRLLEHYEAHHQLLAEKIQQTELAAEQTARIQPVWTDAETNNDVCRLPSALSKPKCKSPPVPPASTARTISASFPHSVLGLAAPSTGAAPPAPAAAVEPPRPQLNSVATNTNGQSKHTIADARPQVVPSFNEALLSAKNRMLQLEQESDLLEQSFLGYLERARAQKQKLNIRASCARERQQIHRTLDSFREWQRRIRREDVQLNTVIPPVASPVYSGSELDQDSYQFTNAIAVARRKLFSELQATSHPVLPAAAAAAPQLELELELPAMANKMLADQVQHETQHLLSRVEATLARVSQPASLQLMTAESQLGAELEADLLSSGTLTSLADMDRLSSGGDGGDEAITPPASRKLQRSMARMNQLFGTHAEAQASTRADALPKPNMKPPSRPWSAPTSILNSTCPPTALAQRPHTAPSSRTEVAPAHAGGPNLLGLLDALSDVGNTTANSSSLGSNLGSNLGSSLDNRPTAMREVYAQLVSNASSASHASSSPSALSHSLEFWKRVNL
ncbi:uncharacterized protein unc isoform X2 [Drosophila montana]|uniref:uncharacterized protein unc isoform X2 n=1 Tax=Drosophila montana TaxID=40370 RepID=UPI00313C787A